MIQTEYDFVREAKALNNNALPILILISMFDNVYRGFMNCKLDTLDLLFPHAPMGIAEAEIANKLPRLFNLRQITLYFKLPGVRGAHSHVG